MDLLALGSSSKEIAAALKISVRTVEGHRRVVLRKMGVSSVAHLAPRSRPPGADVGGRSPSCS
jgi:DNA-binding CsgD family transcriptional regulator